MISGKPPWMKITVSGIRSFYRDCFEKGVVMSDRLNIIDTIEKQEKFSTFAKLMTSSGANDVFKGPGPFTVFVPTNDAFVKYPAARMTELLNEPNQPKLKALLSYHILGEKVMAANIGGAPTRIALTGEELTFADSNGLRVNGASVQARNMEATNGVVHGVDTVLQPSSSATAVAAAAAAASAGTVPPVVPSVAPPVTATEIPTPDSSSSVLSSPTTSHSAEEAHPDIKSII